MELALPYVTIKDSTLTHQVQMHLKNFTVMISCNCRARRGNHSKAGKFYYDPMGPSRCIEESRRLYNDSANHWAPFSDNDRAKW